MLVPAAAVQWTDTWNTVGLRGTASDRFSLRDHFVPEDHSITRDHRFECREPGPLYRLPANLLYQIGFAGVALGIARGALDAFTALAIDKVPRGQRSLLRENAKSLSADLRAALAKPGLAKETRAHYAEALSTLEEALKAPLQRAGV